MAKPEETAKPETTAGEAAKARAEEARIAWQRAKVSMRRPRPARGHATPRPVRTGFRKGAEPWRFHWPEADPRQELVLLTRLVLTLQGLEELASAARTGRAWKKAVRDRIRRYRADGEDPERKPDEVKEDGR